MKTVTSKDGTTIAYDRRGTGPALILVDGALGHRAMDLETSHIATSPLLTEHFSVYHYDRRGRGDSTNTQPFAVEREIEDIEALIDEAGDPAFVLGLSSGAALAMEAAIKLGPTKINKLAMYEAPYNDDETARQAFVKYRKDLDELLADNRKGDMVARFMIFVGMSPDHVPHMKQHPMWTVWEAVGPTLIYDAAALGDDASVPTGQATRVAMPTLVMDGSESFPFMHPTAVALANAMPKGHHRTLTGQTHEVKVEAIAPLLVEFFLSEN